MVALDVHKPAMTESAPSALSLRRIGQHLRQRDWFAVGVEVLAVILGVFLGLQVSNWNDERQERQDERQILERLHDETQDLLTEVREERADLQVRADHLVEAQPVIYALEPARPLTSGECNAIITSHVYRMASDELPVLDELVATGRFDRLRDEEVRRLLRNYILFRERQRANHTERTNELFRLYSRHPETIEFFLEPEAGDRADDWTALVSEGNQWNVRCDIAKMRGSQPFRNELFDNISRNSSVLEIYDAREEMLVELDARLTALLD